MEKDIVNILLKKNYRLTEGTDGETLTLEVDFISKEDGDPEGIYMKQRLIQTNSQGNKIVIGLSSSPIQPKDFRRVSDFIEVARIHAIQLNEDNQRKFKQRNTLLDPKDIKHFVFVPIVEFLEQGGKMEENRFIFTEFQGRYYEKMFHSYENGIVYAKEYPDDPPEVVGQMVYVKCPAKAQYV